MDFSKKRIHFGQYAEIHDGTDNTASGRSVEGITMYRTNDREGFAFMCLDTGKYRHSNNWTQKPITAEIKQRVENMVKDVVNVKTLMEEIEAYVEQEIMQSALRQEETRPNINIEEDNDDYNENGSLDDSSMEDEIPIIEEHAENNNEIPIVEDVISSDEENDDVQEQDNLNDIAMGLNCNDSSSEAMSNTEIDDTLQSDNDKTTDVANKQGFEEACIQARVIDI